MRKSTLLPLLLAAACAHSRPLVNEDEGAIKGRVSNLHDGQPVPQATIIAAPHHSPFTITEFTDLSGAFSFGDLPPGVYDLQVIYGDATTFVDAVPVQPNRVTHVAAQLAADVGEPVHGIALPTYLTPPKAAAQPASNVPWR